MAKMKGVKSAKPTEGGRRHHLIAWVTSDQHALVKALSARRGETMGQTVRTLMSAGYEALRQQGKL